MNCPTKEQLIAGLSGKVAEDEIEAIFAHVEQCASCNQRIESLETSSPSDPDELSLALRSSWRDSTLSKACRQLIDSSTSFVYSPSPQGLSDFLETVDSIRDYDLGEQIGEGGMGRVYRARHKHLKRDVAIKVLSPRRFGNAIASSRFRQEMEAAGRLDHPNIVQAFDAGEHEGILFLAMELVRGIDLGSLVDSVGRLAFPVACEIGCQTAKGLAYAHSTKMVHRDIKPGNLMVTRSGRVRILDFGLAKLDDDDEMTFAGSIEYMAPEQYEHDRRVGDKSDIFGLGCVLLHAISGRPPFAIESGQSMADRIDQRRNASSSVRNKIEQLIQELNVPTELGETIKRMVDDDPDHRPTAAELVEQFARWREPESLKTLLAGVSPKALPATSSVFESKADSNADSNHQQRKPVARFRRLLVLAVVLIGLLAVWQSGMLKNRNWNSTGSIPQNESTPTSRVDENLILSAMSANPRRMTILVVGKSDDDNVRVCVSPGYEMVVQFEKDNQEFRAWDLLNLKLKHESAFLAYEKFQPVIQQFEDETYHPDKLADDVDMVMVVSKPATGGELIEAWTDGQVIRLFYDPQRKSMIQIGTGDSRTTREFRDQKSLGNERIDVWCKRLLRERTIIQESARP